MTEMGPLAYAYSFNGSGGGLEHTNLDDFLAQNHDRFSWLHLELGSSQTRTVLEKQNLNPIVVEALLAEETRPRATHIDEGVLVMLRGVNLNENAQAEDMVSIRLWVEEGRIISTRRRKLKAIQDIRAAIHEGTGPKNTADFVIMLCTRLFRRIDPVVQEMDEDTDDIEQRVLDGPDLNLRKSIIDIRKKAIILRRYIAPQRDSIMALRNVDLPWFDRKHKQTLQENIDHLSRYVEDLDAIRDRAQVVKDEIVNMMSDTMNRNLYALSLIAALFLPLGFLTGLLGINVGGMPGVEDSAAFWVVVIACGILLVLEYLVFRWLRWL